MQKTLIICLLLAFVSITTYAQKIKIVENSRIGKYAARLHKKDAFAVTIGNRIYLNCSKEEFFESLSWMRHELTHVEQYRRQGLIGFLARYLFYSIFHKYESNPFEREAIAAEFSSE